MKVLAFDPERCTGARACEATCAQTWFDVTDPERSSIRIHTDGGDYRARFCIQCGACVDVCPVEALWQAPNGVVHVRKNRCVGCMACVGFCPYSVMFADTDHAQPFKCVACGQCVDACPNDALAVVDVEEPSTALWSSSLTEEL
jgi:anaerobic carbon-monoxide dehydrogenase iron sulfur subunit